MSNRAENNWLGRRGGIRYVPPRYQAQVASIVAALLFYNIFRVLMEPTNDSGACGSLFRPVIKGDSTPGWIWNSSPFHVNASLNCPQFTYGLWWNLFGSFIGLAICGIYLRQAIGREKQALSPDVGPKTWASRPSRQRARPIISDYKD